MAEYVWQHDLGGERDRLRLMSDILDPSSRFHLRQTGVGDGWQCLEIGAGNGSLSQWLASQVGSTGHVTASDIRTDLMAGIEQPNLTVRQFDVVNDEPPAASYDLIAVRALLHHLPERREVVTKMASWLKPGGWLFVQEPDFYPTWTVEPPSQNQFWQAFLTWATAHQIDYYVGRKIPGWMQADGLTAVQSEGHAILYNGGSTFAQWWELGIREIEDKLKSEGGITHSTLEEFHRLNRDPEYWTTTISFTATAAQKRR